MSTVEQRQEHARRWKYNLGDDGRREHLRPVTMEMIAHHEEANKLLFEGLMHHYYQCVCTGRLDVWANAAHAAVDLIAHDRVEFIRRGAVAVSNGERDRG